MAIHDFGYRGYGGGRTSTLARVLAIAWSDIAHSFKTRKFLIFFIICISPAIVAFVIVYMRYVVAEGQGQIPGLSRHFARAFDMTDKIAFFVDFSRGTPVLTIIYSAVVGAGIIARDRQAGALEIYFTRGIQPRHYFTGKFLGVFFLLLCQVLFPFLVVSAPWRFLPGRFPGLNRNPPIARRHRPALDEPAVRDHVHLLMQRRRRADVPGDG